MNTNSNITIKPLESGYSANRLIEILFIENHFKNYLTASAVINFFEEPDFKTRAYIQVVKYTKGLFSLEQLSYIFLANADESDYWEYEELDDKKKRILKYIDNISMGDKDLVGNEIFKRKIMDLNPIVFSLLDELIHESLLFWDKEAKAYGYPDIEEYKREYLLNIQELSSANLTIEKAKDICRRYHCIDNRIAALNKEGLNIKTCWVKSGGVTTVFYMKGKKEIRIQIAASKFKGTGDAKNKSALCVVLPLPKLLYEGCN